MERSRSDIAAAIGRLADELAVAPPTVSVGLNGVAGACSKQTSPELARLMMAFVRHRFAADAGRL